MTRHARRTAPAPRQRTRREVTIRTGERGDSPRIHELIKAHLEEGHLLPRTLEELTLHAERFVVGVDPRGTVVACGELAPLSHALAELRSFVVSRRHRGSGVGRRMLDEIRRRARLDGYDNLCAFTHQPGYFVRLDFSIVPHTWLPEKIATDCRACRLFRRCGQYAMVTELEPVRHAARADASLHA